MHVCEGGGGGREIGGIIIRGLFFLFCKFTIYIVFNCRGGGGIPVRYIFNKQTKKDHTKESFSVQ